VIPGISLTFVQGDVGSVHEKMLQAAGGRNAWLVGGRDLVGQFADHGLLEEILLGDEHFVFRTYQVTPADG
jgi:dihydrofolate reductase